MFTSNIKIGKTWSQWLCGMVDGYRQTGLNISEISDLLGSKSCNKQKIIQWVTVLLGLLTKMACWRERSQENGKAGSSWQEGYSHSKIYSLQSWLAEKHFRIHNVKPSGEWTAKEIHWDPLLYKIRNLRLRLTETGQWCFSNLSSFGESYFANFSFASIEK